MALKVVLLLVLLNPLGWLDAIAGLPMASRAVSRAGDGVRPPSVTVEMLFRPIAQVIRTQAAIKSIAFRRKKARIKRACFDAAKRLKRNVVVHVIKSAGGFRRGGSLPGSGSGCAGGCCGSRLVAASVAAVIL